MWRLAPERTRRGGDRERGAAAEERGAEGGVLGGVGADRAGDARLAHPELEDERAERREDGGPELVRAAAAVLVLGLGGALLGDGGLHAGDVLGGGALLAHPLELALCPVLELDLVAGAERRELAGEHAAEVDVGEEVARRARVPGGPLPARRRGEAARGVDGGELAGVVEGGARRGADGDDEGELVAEHEGRSAVVLVAEDEAAVLEAGDEAASDRAAEAIDELAEAEGVGEGEEEAAGLGVGVEEGAAEGTVGVDADLGPLRGVEEVGADPLLEVGGGGVVVGAELGDEGREVDDAEAVAHAREADDQGGPVGHEVDGRRGDADRGLRPGDRRAGRRRGLRRRGPCDRGQGGPAREQDEACEEPARGSTCDHARW